MSSIMKFALEDPSAMKKMCDDVKKKLTKAAASAVNSAAFQARQNVVESLGKYFTVRNDFTARQAQYTKAPIKAYTNIADIKASVGFTEKAAYMARQDEGGEHTNPNGGTLNIGTDRKKQSQSNREALPVEQS